MTIGAVATLEDVMSADSAHFRLGEGDFEEEAEVVEEEAESAVDFFPAPLTRRRWSGPSVVDDDDSGGGVTVMIWTATELVGIPVMSAPQSPQSSSSYFVVFVVFFVVVVVIKMGGAVAAEERSEVSPKDSSVSVFVIAVVVVAVERPSRDAESRS